MNSIRRQLYRELMGIHAVLLGASVAVLAALVWRSLVGSFDSALRTRALALTALTEWEHGRVQFDFSDDFLRGFGAERPRSYFEVWDAKGTALARSPSLKNLDLAQARDGSPDRPGYWNLTLPNGRSARGLGFTFVPAVTDAPAGAGPVQPVRLVMAVDRGSLDETIEGILAAILASSALLFLANFFIVPRVLRRGLASLDQLGHQAAQIDAGSLAKRFRRENAPVEIGPIVDRLNELLGRLDASFERERRFSADLAHELRTPIAELRSLAECALKWPEARDPAMDHDTLDIARQMERLVEQILTLAQGDADRIRPDFGPVEMQPAIAQAWQPFADHARLRQIEALFTVAPATIRADRALLRSILANLMDNAVAHSPGGGPVLITGCTAPEGYVVEVANPAPDLDASDLPRLFDRLWRKDLARSGGEHFGLGLSLANTFAQAMDWRLSARLDAKGWVVFRLEYGFEGPNSKVG